MAKSHPTVEPRTFFLNELHELREEHSGRGALPKFGSIDWHAQGQKISHSLKAAKAVIDGSRDPIRGSRYFLVANPVTAVEKVSTSTKTGIQTDRHEKPRFDKDHGQVFGRLGVDLINVTKNGDALVHATADRLEQLVDRSEKLGTVGIREQARWMTLQEFKAIPPELRIDQCWLDEIAPREITDAIIELQPLLTVVEIDAVMREINKVVQQQKDERLVGTGFDLSGRQWIRAKVSKPTLESLSKHFFSIQSLHRPLVSIPAAVGKNRPSSTASVGNAPRSSPSISVRSRPTVAVVDTGVPPEHAVLANYRRGEIVRHRDYATHRGAHGSLVASRIVFGDLDLSDGSVPENDSGTCRFLDVHCSMGIVDIDDKTVQEAMSNAIGAYADTRVFNLSIASKASLQEVGEVERTEHRIIAQNLDNFAFQNDVLVVVAAGNSLRGYKPIAPYPRHVDDPNWAMGRWAVGFNTLVVGSHVAELSSQSSDARVGLPSAFSRVGPGAADAPTPSFCASGGDIDRETYQFSPGLGVWCCDDIGRWEDHSGTSFAAPLVAREAALALQYLQEQCCPQGRPFAVAVRAFLALTATKPFFEDDLTAKELTLCKRALGFGVPDAKRLAEPTPESALFLWQGVLEDKNDLVAVQLPIPSDWRTTAKAPRLRVVVAYDPPVNQAVQEVWACRKVEIKLKPNQTPEAKAVASSSRGHRSYPLIDRTYELSVDAEAEVLIEETWRLELHYEEIADYPPGPMFSSQQRVAVAMELFDADEVPMSPQPFLQALPVTTTMTRLSVPPATFRTPIILPTR